MTRRLLATAPHAQGAQATKRGKRQRTRFGNLLDHVKADPSVVRRNAPYYDMVNFALQIKVPTLVGVGLCDGVCPAPSIWGIYNHIPGQKQLVVSVQGVHFWNAEMLKTYPEWIRAGLR